jgi:predicted PurR-regulated permease PerM
MAVLLRAIAKMLCKLVRQLPMKAAVGIATALLLGALTAFGVLMAPRISE